MVSIVLVTYNRAERLRLSIQDILDQTFRDFELIICDDCSTDHTASVCNEFAAVDNRIRYFRHQSNQQMPGNLNFGIEQSQFEYIAILHDGDRFRLDLIQQWYNAISKNPTVGFVFNSIGDSDRNDHVIKAYHEFPEGIVKKDELLKSVYFRRPHFDSPVYGEAMVRKELVKEYGFLKKEYGFYSDVDLWMELLHKYDAYYCADTLIKCPLKSLQPHLFQNDIIKFNIYMFSMHLKHRKKAYHGNFIKRAKELVIFRVHALFHITYCLLLVVKNFTFRYFIESRQYLKRYSFLLVPWGLFLFFYPLIKLIMRSMQWRKEVTTLGKPLSANSPFIMLGKGHAAMVVYFEEFSGIAVDSFPAMLMH